MIHKLEALLFVAGDEGLSIQELALQLNVTKPAIRELMIELNRQLEKANSSLFVLQKNETLILTTRSEYKELLAQFTNNTINKRLSKASLEVLAIIAYKQPITRLEIEQIRGVQSSGALQKLNLYQLITEVGRVDGPGRARLYGTTDYFLEYFGLKTLQDLPEIDLEAETESSQNLFAEFDEILQEDT